MNAIEAKELANKKDFFSEEVKNIEWHIEYSAKHGKRSLTICVEPEVKELVKSYLRNKGFKVSGWFEEFFEAGVKISW